eukprot:TRINITY_DN623_c0_g1_i1.p1 TRINITY_DN623_c0_g1~~TRINITY_DN623_c0_g1_i1.p1  ORF type:complete len:302 (-),score=72.30 TRINITY_DN623_c0_g1_i1:100-942(-)
MLAKRAVRCISWNKSRFDNPMVALGCMDGSVQIFEFSQRFKGWKRVVSLPCVSFEGSLSHPLAVTSVDWSRLLGRSYHLIAAGYAFGCVRVFSVDASNHMKYREEYRSHCGGGQIGSVKWTAIASTLMVALDSGSVAMCRKTRSGWETISEMSIRASETNENEIVNGISMMGLGGDTEGVMHAPIEEKGGIESNPTSPALTPQEKNVIPIVGIPTPLRPSSTIGAIRPVNIITHSSNVGRMTRGNRNGGRIVVAHQPGSGGDNESDDGTAEGDDFSSIGM